MDQQIINGANGLKYFAILPHLADELLDPWEYRLYGHYLRVCGATNRPCLEATATTAERCKMSAGKVSSTRRSLEEKGFVTLHQIVINNMDRLIVTLTDIWPANMRHFEDQAAKQAKQPSFADTIEAQLTGDRWDGDWTRSPGERVVHEVNGVVHEVNGVVHEVNGVVHEVNGVVHEVNGVVHEVNHKNNYMKNNQLEETTSEESDDDGWQADGGHPRTPLKEIPTRDLTARAKSEPDREIHWPGQGEAWPRHIVETAAAGGIELCFGDAWHNPAAYVRNLDDNRLWLLVEWLHYIERGGGLLDETARNPVGVIRSHIQANARPGASGCGLPRRDTDAIRTRLRRIAHPGDNIPY